MDTSILEDLGFTNAEIKVYLALLELGVATAGPILDKSGLQNSVVHMTLHKLVEKGFVSFVKKGKVKRYQATDPRNIVKFIEEKKTKFEGILPELLLKRPSLEPQEAEVFEGLKGLKAMLYDVVKDAKKGDEYLYFSFYTKNPDDYENVYNFYVDFEKERHAKGIVVKGLAPMMLKSKLASRKNVKFVNFPIPLNISIFQDKVVFTPWEDKQVSFLVHSRQLAVSFREFFNSIWKTAK